MFFDILLKISTQTIDIQFIKCYNILKSSFDDFGIGKRPESEETLENLANECRRCKIILIESLRQKDRVHF